MDQSDDEIDVISGEKNKHPNFAIFSSTHFQF